MTHPRFTVVHRQKFLDSLTELWLEFPDTQRAVDELEPVLRTIPDQAGQRFEHDGEEVWYIAHRTVEIIYFIHTEDCQVHLFSIRRKMD